MTEKRRALLQRLLDDGPTSMDILPARVLGDCMECRWVKIHAVPATVAIARGAVTEQEVAQGAEQDGVPLEEVMIVPMPVQIYLTEKGVEVLCCAG